MIQYLRRENGFTLPELLVAMGLSLAILGSVYGLFRSQMRTVKGQETRMEAHEYATAVLDMMVREIRNTGYFPAGAPCATTPANTGGIITATAESFRLVYDANGDGACDEDVSFTYDAAARNILRNGQPMTDGNATSVQFRYFPQQTSPTVPPPFCFSEGNPSDCSGMLVSNLATVQQIRISLTIRSKNPDAQYGGPPNVTMSSTADLRNHGLSS